MDEKLEFRCILFWQFLAIHRRWSILAHPDVYCIKIWTHVHRDGNRILNPDVSPTETSVTIHRKGPKSGISDACSKNHTFRIHRDSTRIPDSDVSKNRIHRNSIKAGNPDVSPPLQVYQIKQPALPHTSNSKRISAQIIVKPIETPKA